MTPTPPERTGSDAPPPSRRDLLGLGAGIAAAGAALGCRASPHAMNDSTASTEGDELDELLADLTDQSSLHEPIHLDERAARVRRLGDLLDGAGLDALLIEPGATMSYLTEVAWGLSERLFALVVFSDGTTIWVCPDFEVSRAEAAIRDAGGPGGAVVGWDENEHAYAPLASALVRRGVKRIAIEPRVRAFVMLELAAELGADAVVSGVDVLRELRGVKDAHELALLRAASELTQRAIVAVAERLRTGTTDHEIGRMVRRAQERLGLRRPGVLPLIGEDAAIPHGGPTGRRLAVGDEILVDTGGSLHGYKSDTTRSWIFEATPTRAYERAWNTVRDAQRAAFDAMRPGVPAKEIDRAARAVVADAGYGDGFASFTHRLGHGIGLEGHEEPYLDGGNPLPLAPGMTFTNEPGIYLPGELGIRLEDVVVVTEDGADHFGDWPTGPRTPR